MRELASKTAIAIAVAGTLGCGKDSKSKPAEPLDQAIIGEWVTWCRTDEESTSTCLGKEKHELFKRFQPGGTLVAGAPRGTTMSGTWMLSGDRLVTRFEGGGKTLTEEYRARIEDDKLILWNDQRGFGQVCGRKDAAFEAADSEKTSGGPFTRQIGSVRYRLELPKGYRLARDDNDRQRWEPPGGEGFAVRLTLGNRSKTKVGDEWVTPPCHPRESGSVTGSRATIDGVERETSIGTGLCLDDPPKRLSCSAEHTRGYLEESERDAALALCKSLEVVR